MTEANKIETEKIVLATGYKPANPGWLSRFSDIIIWEDDKHFRVTEDYQIAFKEQTNNHIYTLTKIDHSHGASATNLGLSVLRNQKIINSIAGKELYSIPKKTVFQQFS